MDELLTAAQMRAIERAAIASGEVTGLELMERAGRGVVEAVFEEWPDLATAPHRAVVLCGPGNNGGDGFVVARLLKEWGWEVEVFLYGDPDKLPPDARLNYERWCGMGEVDALEFQSKRLEHFAPRAHLLVDAVFGTGLTRPLDEDFKLLWLVVLNDALFNLEEEEGVPQRIVAVDIPSGVCADSGRVLGAAIPWVDLAVSFHTAKVGHCFMRDATAIDGQGRCGRVVTKSIGLGGSPRPRVGVKPPPGGADGGCPAVPPGERVRQAAPRLGPLRKWTNHHKYTHGHALILSGGAGKTGAARLAARGALRIGAGLVTLGVPGSAQQEVASQITALMLRRVDDADGLADVLEDARFNALCLGPGLGVERAGALVAAALGRGGVEPRPVVLDADALTAIAGDAALFSALHDTCVLTPHAGEFARLFPDIAEKLAAPATSGPAYSKVDATRAAAKRAGCTVLYKGPDTVIADPSGRCSINSAHYDRAAPWLATAGSGDVLSGFIAGLLARGFAPMQSAETAAWLHVECARRFGPGLIAEDIPEQLPAVLRDLAAIESD